MKTQMKTTRVLDHISKPRVIFICLLIGHQDLWIKTNQIEHKNNTLHQLRVLETMYTEFLLACCLPSSENLNGLLVFVLCTFRLGLYKQRIFFLHTFGRSKPARFILLRTRPCLLARKTPLNANCDYLK